MEQVIDKLLERCFYFMDEILELSTIVEDLRKEVSQLKEENKELKDKVSIISLEPCNSIESVNGKW